MIQDFLQVFLMTLVSDIDNMLILGAVLRRHSYFEVTFLAAVMLTITRTAYVCVVEGLSDVPMFHFLTGLILLFISYKLVTKLIYGVETLRSSRSIFLLQKIKILAALAATDFLICWDGVLIVSNISDHIPIISIGIFCSLLISLYFLRLIIKLAAAIPWINVVAGGFIAQNAIMSMAKDPWIEGWINYADEFVPEVNIVNTAANGAVIIIVVIGLISYIKHHRIIIHRKF
ncbi:TerC family protein [Siminovitchia fortis]|uniref:Uncharacterized protein n=1 Tax=Siminovitchia fortis TaxID=254758 RepID=A0A443IZ31_9BACI|nr:hypothetical protein [Siminovitchia fortis]RWR13508.1 hypothetical protein D4N35_004740 [Siminovitchia fortis]WHY81749.1 hypothetical protein QNH23_18070 [Siminovitchia fortis]